MKVSRSIQLLVTSQPTYNLGQNKWKTQTLPSPKIKNGKLLVFALFAVSSLIWGERSLLFHFILSKIVATRRFSPIEKLTN